MSAGPCRQRTQTKAAKSVLALAGVVLAASVTLTACGGPETDEPTSDERTAAVQAGTAEPGAGQIGVEEAIPPEPRVPLGTLGYGFVDTGGVRVRALMFYRENWTRLEPLPNPLIVPIGPTGEFLVQDPPAGRYYLAAYQGSNEWIDALYLDQEEADQAVREIVEDDLSFLGSYRLVRSNGPAPDMIVAQSVPRQRVLLERLEPRLRGTPWERRLAEYLAPPPANPSR